MVTKVGLYMEIKFNVNEKTNASDVMLEAVRQLVTWQSEYQNSVIIYHRLSRELSLLNPIQQKAQKLLHKEMDDIETQWKAWGVTF
jgi:hypothetical protein